MLQTDEIILKILLKAKNEENQLLKHFKISYPSKQVVQESNSIFVGAVDSESNIEGFDFSSFTDLVEILIVTKNRNYTEALKIIKTVSKEITRLIYENNDLFDNKPIIRNITPEYNRDFVLTRGHLRIQVKSKPESLVPSEEDYYLCNLLLEKIEEKWLFMVKFDLDKELDDLLCPNMFKSGLRYYISSNNISINNKKEFEKIIKEYANLKIGGWN